MLIPLAHSTIQIAIGIASLKDHSYQPNPARRTYIAKKNNPAKKRPLGIPSTDDKLVQEIIRMLLEAIYEPTFSELSHGFRPKRSCHTALSQIKHSFIGSKQDALTVKEDIRNFLAGKLKLTLSEEKTKVTHSSKAVRYLGYDIKVLRSKAAKRDKNGVMRRVWYGKVFLYVPHEKWENKLHEYRVMKVKWDVRRNCDFWRPMPRNALLNNTDIEIVS